MLTERLVKNPQSSGQGIGQSKNCEIKATINFNPYVKLIMF